ncbi:hypothetical protein [Lacinutrix algicola]|uniref:hypothetical protein n=1 Tax=Lacinutrix algicola TaxID=342954 RepID=UPI0006E44662|nr:hypothetical protein [Lacinutrix algicola]
MKNLIFLLLILIYSQNCSAQKSKKTIYLDEKNKEISKEKFKSIDKNKLYIIKSKSDNQRIKKIIYKENYSKLDSNQLNQVYSALKKIIGSDFNPNKNTLIHLFDENNKHLEKVLENERYWSWIYAHSDKIQSYVFGSKDSEIKEDITKSVFFDKYDLIKNLFITNKDFKINHVFIEPNGKIIVFYG